MKFRRLALTLLACAAAGFAQEHMADGLRNGIVEEDSKQNPGNAIRQYQAVLNEFAAARQTAATALFRMAESYRKLGNRGQAISAYQRVLRDFADQTKLAAQSRRVLANTYKANASENPQWTSDFLSRMQQVQASAAQSEREELAREQAAQSRDLKANAEELAQTKAARARYRAAIENQISVLKQQLTLAEDRYKGGVAPADAVENLKLKVLEMERDLAAFDAGINPAK